MKFVIFGLSISSSWGNGHATLWRGWSKALARRGHQVIFFEKDVPYYAAHRDLWDLPGGSLILYTSWDEVRVLAARHLQDAEVGMVTSFCPDGIAAADLLMESSALRVFYDLDTPVTLSRHRSGERLSYLGRDGLTAYELVLSFTGGEALEQLRTTLGATRVEALYGSVDPEVHYPVRSIDEYRAELSYLGTYAADRQRALNALFLEPAHRAPARRFLLAGAQYPPDFPWAENIYFVRHLEPQRHAAFLCSSRLTLNVTREAMAQLGYCPSGRIFEAAACGVPVISDEWDGLREFFRVGSEILVARSTEDVLAALEMSDAELQQIGRAARERVLAEHTAEHRVTQLEAVLEAAREPAFIGGT